MRSDRYRQDPTENSAGEARRLKDSPDRAAGAGRHSRSGKAGTKRRGRALSVLLVIIVLLITAVSGAAVYSYKSAADSLSLTFTEDSPDVEFRADCPVMDHVKSYEGDVSAESDSLDTSSVGSHKMTFTVSKPVLGGLFKPSKEFTFSYNVTDNIPPLILRNGSGTIIELGTDFDLNSVIAYGDNADPNPSVETEGSVDTEKNGEYPLTVTITDASGNSTKASLIITVADSVPACEDTSERTPFSDFKDKYSSGAKAFGIDVSAWQDEIDFDAVKSAGCDFVMIRIGYGSGNDFSIDKRFSSNIKKAEAAGLKTGIYFYSYDNTEDGVRESARQIIDLLGGSKTDLPVAFDWEDFGSFQTYGISFAELNDLYEAFADELSEAGYDPMLYGSKYYLENVWDGTGSRPVWLAHYTDKTDYSMPFVMWQASCTGSIDGINTAVDMDIMY